MTTMEDVPLASENNVAEESKDAVEESEVVTMASETGGMDYRNKYQRRTQQVTLRWERKYSLPCKGLGTYYISNLHTHLFYPHRHQQDQDQAQQQRQRLLHNSCAARQT